MVMMQAGDPEEDLKISGAQCSPQGELDKTRASSRIVTNLQDKDGKQHFEEVSEGCGVRIAEAW